MPGISVLFWNVHSRPLEQRVARLVRAHAVDVVVLAECGTQPSVVSRTINAEQVGTFHVVPDSGSSTYPGLRVFTRLALTGWQVRVRDVLGAWVGFSVSAPSVPDLLLFILHLPSKQWTTSFDRLLGIGHLQADIREQEQYAGHERTVVVGDLNVNPFEEPVAWAGGLHGVMDANVAARGTREVQGRAYSMFYNPMWSVLGDRTPGPPGTYYRSASESVNYFWNTYDQVLVRPALTAHLSTVRVLDTDGTDSLLNANGTPDVLNGSDHLPILFRLDW